MAKDERASRRVDPMQVDASLAVRGVDPMDGHPPDAATAHAPLPRFRLIKRPAHASSPAGEAGRVLAVSSPGHTGAVSDRNVLGGELELCGTDPLTGFYRNGCCSTGPEDRGSHTICAVVTAEFLEHQRGIGNDLSTPRPEYGFPGLVPGARWCVTAVNWLRAHEDGAAAYVVLASTHQRALEIVPLAALEEHAVDVPGDLGVLGD